MARTKSNCSAIANKQTIESLGIWLLWSSRSNRSLRATNSESLSSRTLHETAWGTALPLVSVLIYNTRSRLHSQATAGIRLTTIKCELQVIQQCYISINMLNFKWVLQDNFHLNSSECCIETKHRHGIANVTPPAVQLELSKSTWSGRVMKSSGELEGIIKNTASTYWIFTIE